MYSAVGLRLTAHRGIQRSRNVYIISYYVWVLLMLLSDCTFILKVSCRDIVVSGKNDHTEENVLCRHFGDVCLHRY